MAHAMCYNKLMDNFEYLNQISKTSRPVQVNPTGKKGLNTSLVVKIVLGSAVIFFLLLALGAMLGNIGNKTNDLTKQLYLRTTNLNATVGSYNRYLKSSKLRATTVALSSVLTNASNQLSSYLTKDGAKASEIAPPEKIIEEETNLIGELNLTLENSRLNGILDRIYHAQIELQVTLLISLSSQLLARTNDDELKSIVTTLENSLETIHANLETYTIN